jgi:tetratricopeptide (TPR) repeat protein
MKHLLFFVCLATTFLARGAETLSREDSQILNDSDYKAAIAACESENGQLALTHSQTLIRKFPDHYLAYQVQGDAYVLVRFWPEAVESYKHTIKLNASEYIPWYRLGCVNASFEKFEDSIAAFKTAIKIKPNEIAPRVNLARSLEKSNRIPEAIEVYQEATKVDPKNVPALVNLAVLYGKIDRRDDEIAIYEKVLKIDPNESTALNNLCVSYLNYGQKSKAEEIWQKLKKSDSKKAETLDPYFRKKRPSGKEFSL